MWMPRSMPEKKNGGNGLIAVAIDKDKGSQIALKWAIDNLLVKGQTVILIHVNLKSSLSSYSASPSKDLPFNLVVHADYRCKLKIVMDSIL